MAYLKRIIRFAAHLIRHSQKRKLSHVSSYMMEVLRWLPVRQCIVYTLIQYWVASLVWRCLLGLDPTYLIGLCRYVSGIAGGRSRRSAGRGSPFSPVCSYYYHANPRFCMNGLNLELRLLSRLLSDTFYNVRVYCILCIAYIHHYT